MAEQYGDILDRRVRELAEETYRARDVVRGKENEHATARHWFDREVRAAAGVFAQRAREAELRGHAIEQHAAKRVLRKIVDIQTSSYGWDCSASEKDSKGETILVGVLVDTFGSVWHAETATLNGGFAATYHGYRVHVEATGEELTLSEERRRWLPPLLLVPGPARVRYWVAFRGTGLDDDCRALPR